MGFEQGRVMTTIHVIVNDPVLCDEYRDVLKSAGYQVEINRFGSMAMIVVIDVIRIGRRREIPLIINARYLEYPLLRRMRE